MSYRSMQKKKYPHPQSTAHIAEERNKEDQKARVSQPFPLNESGSRNACQLTTATDVTGQ